MEHFPTKLFSIAEENCRFIDIHSCLGSILNVFHNKMQCILYIHLYIINTSTTAINICKKLHESLPSINIGTSLYF